MEGPLALRQGIYYVRSPSNSHIDKVLRNIKLQQNITELPIHSTAQENTPMSESLDSLTHGEAEKLRDPISPLNPRRAERFNPTRFTLHTGGFSFF